MKNPRIVRFVFALYVSFYQVHDFVVTRSHVLYWYAAIGLVRFSYWLGAPAAGEWVARVTGLRARLEAFMNGQPSRSA